MVNMLRYRVRVLICPSLASLTPAKHAPCGELNSIFAPRHHPVGTLYDAAGAQGPWHLTVHFLSFPEAEILSCQDGETGKTLFFQSLKEAIIWAVFLKFHLNLVP